MVSSIFKQAAGILRRRKLNKRWQRVLACMAVLVTVGTVTFLMLTGRAMTRREEILDCPLEVHTHTEECLDADEELACGYLDFVVHVHSEEYCYNEEGERICPLPETEEHVHTDECYERTETLICELEETEPSETTQAPAETAAAEPSAAETEAAPVPAHEHTDACYEKTLACEKTEHAHADTCYGKTLACTAEEHAHADACYQSTQVCVEEDPAHEHTEACFEKTLACAMEEHAHGDACYEEQLTCAQEEHAHTENCYQQGADPVCGLEETPAEAGTEETPAATEAAQAVTEAAAQTEEAHVHTKECYEIEETLICELPQWHTHIDACYDQDGVLACEVPGLHTHTEECFGEDGARICGQLQLEEHIHTEACVKVVDQTVEETTGAHIHEEACYDEDGALICGYDETETSTEETTESETTEEETTMGDPETLPGAADGAADIRHIAESYEYVDDAFRLIFHVEGDVALPQTEKETPAGKEGAEGGNGTPEGEAGETGEAGQTASEEGSESVPEPADGNEAEAGTQPPAVEETSAQPQGDSAAQPEEGEAAAENMEQPAEGEKAEDGENAAQPAGAEDVKDGEGEAQPVGSGSAGDGEDETQATGGEEAESQEDAAALPGDNENHIEENGASAPAVETLGAEEGEFEFRVEKLGEDSQEYEAFLAGAGEEESAGLRLLQAMELGWSLSWGDTQLDLSGCQVTVEILPAKALVEELSQTIVPETEEGSDGEMQEGPDTETAGDGEGQEAAQYELVLQAVELSEDQELCTLGSMKLGETGTDAADTGMTVGLTERTLALRIDSRLIEPEALETVMPIKETFDYEDDAFAYTFRIEGEVTLPKTEADPEESGAEPQEKPEEGSEVSEAENGEPEADLETGGSEPSETEEAAGDEETEAVSETGEEPSAEESAGDGEGGTDAEAETETTAPAGEGTDALAFEFHVEQLAENSPEYAAFQSYTEQAIQTNTAEDEIEERTLRAISYSLTYEGEDLDLSDCRITVEVTPLIKEGEEPVQIRAMRIDEDGQVDAAGIVEEAAEENVAEENAVEENAEIENDDTLSFVIEGNSNTLAFETLPSPINPKFTIQYYANLEVLKKTGENALPVIDTSGGKLPENGKGGDKSPNGNPIRNIYVDDSGRVLTEKIPVEVYTSRAFEYVAAPSIKYMNALIDNANYELAEVWVLRTDKDVPACTCRDENGSPVSDLSKCTERSRWTIYTYSTDLHFTNRESAATAKPGGNSGYIYVADQTVFRFVYNITNAEPDFEVNFYDYDITSGRMYTSVDNAIVNSNNGITQTGSQGSGTLYYAYTKEAGINSAGNYSGSGTKLAFGNVNTGTSMGQYLWNGNLLNKYNGTQGSFPAVVGSYKGCTFGLVTGLSGGRIQYATGVNAPKLFNEGGATGKTPYTNGEYSLKFIRSGDTYTLTAVNGTEARDLESFRHPSPYAGKVHTHIWTNDFWPMDSAASFGTNGHDLKFGSYTERGNRAYAGSDTKNENGSTKDGTLGFPYADDGKDHNSYFGMNFTVEFELSKDYIGPLEYYFFGDDDMWVFLDDRLVCDIGGVHSSVGEYVNLWDYLEKGSEGKHTLTFFYTERGASGSTCWMQFTLPTVSSIKPEDKTDYGDLRVEKTVTRISSIAGEKDPVLTEGFDTEEEFLFTIKLQTPDGKDLADDYCYVKYDA